MLARLRKRVARTQRAPRAAYLTPSHVAARASKAKQLVLNGMQPGRPCHPRPMHACCMARAAAPLMHSRSPGGRPMCWPNLGRRTTVGQRHSPPRHLIHVITLSSHLLQASSHASSNHSSANSVASQNCSPVLQRPGGGLQRASTSPCALSPRASPVCVGIGWVQS